MTARRIASAAISSTTTSSGLTKLEARTFSRRLERRARCRASCSITPAAPAARSMNPDDAGADPVGRPGTAVPDPGGDGVLPGLAGEVGGGTAAAEQLPGAGNDLVVARGAGAVGGQVLAAGLAQHDRVGDRPAAGGAEAR